MTHRWSDRTMIAFDTETTGVDVDTDRIVTACLASVNGPAPEAPVQWLLNPGVDIPAAATAVHGITTQHAMERGQDPKVVLSAVRDRIILGWEMGHPLVAFNASFDLTILDRELRRHGMSGLDVHGLVIDPLVIDRHVDRFRRGSRKLDAMCAHYQVSLDGAHDAMQDALAAARVAWRILSTHPELDSMGADDLYALQADAHRTWAVEFSAYLASKGKPETIDPSWPIRKEVTA